MELHPLFLLAAAVLGYHEFRKHTEHSTTRKALGGLTLAALLVFGLGLIELPDVEKIIADVGERLGKWTYLLVGVLSYLETGAFIGFIAPGETAVIVGGVVAGQGKIDPVVLIGITWIAAVLGDCTSYWLGRRLGRGFLLRHGRRLRITEERLVQVEGFFERRGGATIFIGRFIGLLRPLAPFVAGASRLPVRTFLPYDVLGAGLWSAIFVMLGYVFWASFDQVTEYAGRGALAFGTLVAIVALIVFLHRVNRDAKLRARTNAWLRRQGERPVVRPLLPVLRPLAGPVRFVADRLTPGELGLELTSLLAIATAGAYAFFALGIRVDGTALLPGDRLGMDIADALRMEWMNELARVLTHLGAYPIPALVTVSAAIWATRHGRIAEAFALVAGILIVPFAIDLAKEFYDRPRPLQPIIRQSGLAYPSGHVANATAYVAAAVVLVRAGSGLALRIGAVGLAFVVVVVVALTRIYLRAHFGTDVLGGAALGLAIFALCGIVALVVEHLRQNEPSSA